MTATHRKPTTERDATPPSGRREEPVDLAEESVAGEEDPGASLGDPQTQRTLQSEANAPASAEPRSRSGGDSIERTDESGVEREAASGAPRERRGDPV